MIGDPLLREQRPVTPPGAKHPNPAHVTMKLIATWAAVIALVAAFVLWFRAVSPDDDWCDQEDTTCIRVG